MARAPKRGNAWSVDIGADGIGCWTPGEGASGEVKLSHRDGLTLIRRADIERVVTAGETVRVILVTGVEFWRDSDTPRQDAHLLVAESGNAALS